MCIYNKSIYTTSRLLYPSNYPILKYIIKCGYCYECLEDSSKEILLRGYYEGLNTFKQNGLILFDTLTYSEMFVPHINEMLSTNYNDNFYCFRDKDVTDFLKLLRIRLRRKYNENGNLKFIITGEYGTDQNCTHRPHYHCIFYYTGKLNGLQLSKLISDCWHYGRTDGVKYKGNSYVSNKRIFKSQSNYSLNITKYVIKYIEKETKYYDVLKERTNRIILDKFGKYYTDLDYFLKLDAQKLRNLVKQYRRISNNFGEYGLMFFNENDYFNHNMLLSYPDTKNVVNFVQMPIYYKRKLFYNLMYYTFDGEILSKWILNERGKLFFKRSLYYKYHNVLNKLHNLYINYDDKHEISKLLNGRTLEDVAKYCTYKRYRYNYKNIEDLYSNLFNENSKPIKSYNTPKLRCIYQNSYIDDKTKTISNLNIYLDEDFEKILSILHNNKLRLSKLRHKEYLRIKELENKYKFYNLK